MKLGMVLAAMMLLVFGTGCATSQSTKAKTLTPSLGAALDLAPYTVATVQPFQNPNRRLEHPEAGLIMANSIQRRLQGDFGPLFDQVRTGTALGQANEIIITGLVREYTPGSKIGRAFGPGITPAKFKADLMVKDAATDKLIMVAPIDKLWAWGGGLGIAKGLDEMMEESAAAAAATVARAKGWQPAAK